MLPAARALARARARDVNPPAHGCECDSIWSRGASLEMLLPLLLIKYAIIILTLLVVVLYSIFRKLLVRTRLSLQHAFLN